MNCASISPFSPRLARLEKGKSARLRASRIREHMTMSLSGPVPRNHSPEDFVRSSRVMRGDPSGEAGFLTGRLLHSVHVLWLHGAEYAYVRVPWRRHYAVPPCRHAGWRHG